MKQNDVILIIVVVFISGMLSFFATSILISDPKNRNTKVEVVEPITAEFNVPGSDDKYFNHQSENITQLIKIGNSTTNPAFKP